MKAKLLIFLFAIFGITSLSAQIIDTLVDVGTHKLHFKIIKGEGTPILFEAGNGDDGSVWDTLVQDVHLRTNASILIYDRAGLGKSEIDTSKISFKQEIKDLECALKKLNYSSDIFLVSHSFGGFYSTLFAQKNKKKVKGTVFIDTASPCFMTEKWSKDFVSDISPEIWQKIKERKEGLFYVLKDLPNITAYMTDRPFPKSIPVKIIAAEKILPMVKKGEEEQWINCLKNFSSLPNREYILAKDCHHKIWLDDKELIVDEVTKSYKKSVEN